jgi:integrase
MFDGPGGIPGMSLRVTPRGVKSYCLLVRVNGKQRRITLGRHPVMTLVAARDAARAALERAEQGIDPATPAPAGAPRTVAELAEKYFELHQRRNQLRRAADVERMLRGSVLPAWGGRKPSSITRAEAYELLDGIAARAPVMANRVASALRRLFRWAVERQYLETSPITGLRAPVRERSRERVLDDRELATIWRAAAGLGWPWAGIVHLMILLASRRSEISGLRWPELDLGGAVWHRPAERMKSGRASDLPLPRAALDLICALPRLDHDRVFPARIGSGTVSSFSDMKRKLDKASGVAGWQLRDLRRTAATNLARLGAPPHVVGAILDHAPATLAGVTSIYNRHGYGPEARKALGTWAKRVDGLVSGQGARVVEIA